MSYTQKEKTDKLELPSNKAYWVELKAKTNYGDSLEGSSDFLNMEPNLETGEVKTKLDLASYTKYRILTCIVDWNLDDEEGNVLPLSVESINLLDGVDGKFLAKEAEARLGERPEKKEVPFEKGSGNVSTRAKVKR
jgi:hypothetical protein